MSILSIFGTNLRELCLRDGSIAKAASELDIHRVQFQRYLKGESFPKPNVLAQICNHFNVDARIMTELLTPKLLADMQYPAKINASGHIHQAKWDKALNYVAPTQDYFNGTHILEDGLYRMWRWAMSDASKMVRVNLQFWTEDSIKFVRGYDSVMLYKGAAMTSGRREFRGVCLKMNWGYTILFFHSEPSRIVSSMYIAPTQLENTLSAYMGYGTLSRDEVPNHRRMSRCVIQKVEAGCSNLVREAHMKSMFDPSEIPPHIRNRIDQPMG